MTRLTERQFILLTQIAGRERFMPVEGDNEHWYFFTQCGFTIADAQALSDRGLIELSEIEGKQVARLAGRTWQAADVGMADYWTDTIGGSYTPVKLGKHQAGHPTTVKRILESVRGTETADVIVGLIFWTSTVLNREQFAWARVRELEKAASPSPFIGEEAKLPCDVHLPPNTIIRKGCTFSVLITAIVTRANFLAEDQSISIVTTHGDLGDFAASEILSPPSTGKE